MSDAYEVIIDGDQVTWLGNRPATGGPTRFRMKLEPLADVDEPNGAKLAQIIRDAVAKHGGITSIDDPVTWQREQRIDHTLPGREP